MASGGNNQLAFAIRAVNEAQKALKEVQGQVDGLASAAEKSNSKFGIFNSTAQKTLGVLGDIAKIAGGFIVAQGLMKLPSLFSDTTSAASDLEQSIGGVQSVFKGYADEILRYGENAWETVGLSKNAFNEIAAPLGAMLKNAGFGMSQVTDLTLQLTQRGADLAATFGGPVEDAMGAIAALMRGEANPIERYGVAIKAVDVEARALADTGKKTAKELTSTELAAARLALFFEQTADSAGQFARESDTAAGKLERLRARQENVAAALGEKLLPAQVKMTEAKLAFVQLISDKVVPVVGRLADFLKGPLSEGLTRVRGFAQSATEFFMNTLVPAVQQFWEQFLPPIQTAISELQQFGAEIVDKLQGPIEQIVRFFQENQGAMEALGAAITGILVVAFGALTVAAGAAAVSLIAAAAPVLAIVAAIGLLSAGIYLLIKHWDTITEKVPFLGKAFDRVKEIASGLASWFTGSLIPTLTSLADAFRAMGEAIIRYVTDHWGHIQRIIDGALTMIMGIVEGAFTAITAVIDGALQIITGIINVFVGVLTGDWERAWDGIKQIVSGAWTIITGVISGAIQTLQGLFSGGMDVVMGIVSIAFDTIKGTISSIIDHIAGLFPQMLEKATGLGNTMKEGFIAGIKGTVGVIGDLTERVWDALKSLINSGIQAINDLIPNSIGFSVLGKRVSIDLPDNPIPMLARGVRNFPGGLAIVGERGPELAVLPRGTDVYSNRETRALLGGNTTYNLTANITIEGNADAEVLTEALDEWWERTKTREFGIGAMRHGVVGV